MIINAIENPKLTHVKRIFLHVKLNGFYQFSNSIILSTVESENKKAIKITPAKIDTIIQYPQKTCLQYQFKTPSILNKIKEFYINIMI